MYACTQRLFTIVVFLASFHDSSVIFEQLAILYALPKYVCTYVGIPYHTIPRYLVKSLRVVLPFFPTGTMERVDTEGQIATAKVWYGMVWYGMVWYGMVLINHHVQTLSTLLSQIPYTQTGPAQIIIFDIHALQVSCIALYAMY